jgi:hypothetical protein
MNPYNSPWLTKPKKPFIKDFTLRYKFSQIYQHLQNNIIAVQYNGILVLDKNIYIAKNSVKFRIKSHLDWAWYTPQTLAQAINNDDIESYYEIMLENINSDPNVWKDNDFEMTLKTYYAARINRASII